MSIHSFDNRADSPWPNATLERGMIIGHTTPTTSRIWVRTGKKGDFQLLVFDRRKDGLGDAFTKLRDEDCIQEDDLMPFPHREPFSTAKDTDYTAVVDLQNLTPATQYTYAVLEKEDDGWCFLLGHEKRRRFRTPKGEGAYAFGLFSCHNPYKKSKIKSAIKNIAGMRNFPDVVNIDVWNMAQDTFARERKDTQLDFLIAGGDQVYCDGCKDVNLWSYLEKCIKGMGQGKRRPSKEEMLSWYRDMYRGYWGFHQIRSIYGQHPTYMIWDDHEIRDGWGSHKMKEGDDAEINEVLFNGWEDYINEKQARELIADMVGAAKQAYCEYQHSHNPPVPTGQYDYHFEPPNSLFYVLDGRGYRDFDAAEYKILGKEQMMRFQKTVEGLAPDKHQFLFVVSAVPVLHMKSMSSEGLLADKINITDDLRDAWENKAHDAERKALLDILFSAAKKGIKVCILSGDVHVTAAFKMQKDDAVIYQLTSSAITYNTPAIIASVLGRLVEDAGESEDGYSFKRMAMLTDPSFALIKVDPNQGRATFQVYKGQEIPVRRPAGDGADRGGYQTKSAVNRRRGEEEDKEIFSHSIAKLELDFKP